MRTLLTPSDRSATSFLQRSMRRTWSCVAMFVGEIVRCRVRAQD